MKSMKPVAVIGHFHNACMRLKDDGRAGNQSFIRALYLNKHPDTHFAM